MEYTAPYTPEQDGVVERAFASVQNQGYAMMIDARLTKAAQGQLWSEAMDAVTSLANITASRTHDTTAYKMFYNKKPTVYSNLQPFGRIGYVTKRNKIKKKFSEKSVKSICLGHANNHAADVYRM